MQKLIDFDFDPRRIPDDYALAIGRMSMAWTQTESVLMDAAAGISGIGLQTTWAIMSHMSFPARCDAVLSIGNLRLDLSRQERLSGLVSRVKRASEDRNRFVHGFWATDEADSSVYLTTVKARGRLSTGWNSVTVPEINKAAAEVYEAGMDLVRFLMDIGALPDPAR